MSRVRIHALMVCTLALARLALPQTAVYYSVGTSVADLKSSGALTVTLQSGTAVFSEAQALNVGVGDEVTYNGGTKAYISGRASSTIYFVTTATGLVPADITGATVNSIFRAFNSLKVAATDSLDSSHLNTSDLVVGNFQLNWPCYNDGPDPSKYVRIEEPWITGPANYIRAYTPTDPSEVGISQRHNGVAGSGYRIVPSGSAGTDFFNFILVSTDNGYVRIEGLEIDGSNLTDGETVRGLMANDGNNSQDVWFSHNLIHDITNSTIDDNDMSRVLGIFLDDTDDSKVSNNIIYNLTSVSTYSDAGVRGIEGDDAAKTHYVYNNTIHNLRATATTGTARGIWDGTGGTMLVRNNYVGLVDSTLGSELCFDGPFAAENNNVSSDTTAVGASSQINEFDYVNYFADITPGSEDFHLLNDSNTLWGSPAADLDSDANLPVIDDIDGGARDASTPDIGADEFATVACAPTTNFRSIGTDATPLANAGTAAVGNGSTTVTFSVTLPGNLGRGDRIVLDTGGVNEIRFISSRDSDTQVTLQQPAQNDHSGGVPYRIERAFNTLQAWEDARDGNLVGENRRELGVAYNDGPFNIGVTIDDSTTDSCRHMWLTVAEGHRHWGVEGTGVLVDSSAEVDPRDGAIHIYNDYTRLDWFEVTGAVGASWGSVFITGPVLGVQLDNLLLHGSQNGARGSGSSPKTATIRNSIFYNNLEDGFEGDDPGDAFLVENCTSYGNTLNGFNTQDSVVTVRNSVGMDNGANDFSAGLGTLVQSYNISSDATASGTGSLTNRNATDSAFPGAGNWVVFESLAGTFDLHLQSSAENDALDAASDLSSTFWTDVDGQSRLGVSWDFGADELVCKIYYADEGSPNTIERADIDGRRPVTLFTNPAVGEPARGIALDVAAGHMYWAEGGTKIRRANLDGTNVQDLVTGLTIPRDIHLDLGAGKMYWTDSVAGKIQSANLDGSGLLDVVTGLTTPRGGPALDLTAGKMYWTEDGGANRIRRANLDGSGIQLLVTGLTGPFGIALDPGAGKMYWTDYGSDKIQRANLDGTGVEDLVTTGLVSARGIDLDLGTGKMYWADYGTGKIQRANLDGSNVEDLVTGLNAPNAVAVGCNIPVTLAPTAVELTSLTATGADGSVVIDWETGSEMNNLGFHLYRATDDNGPYEPITPHLIPGLGSSPAGARYRYADSGLSNGSTYFYYLEDVETTGRTKRHGPVSAMPSATAVDPIDEEEAPSSLITYGHPESNAFRVLRRGRTSAVLELRTEGFYAEPQEDGTVKITIPDFEELGEPGEPAIPVQRQWIDAIAGRKVKLLSVRADDVEIFDGLRPSSTDALELQASRQGTLRAARRREKAFVNRAGFYPDEAARIVDVGFQRDVKKALLELAPMRWSASAGSLWLARRLVVRIAFRGVESNRKVRQGERTVLARLVTETPGLHAVRWEDLFRRNRSRRYSVALSRQGRPVPFHLEPNRKRFGPGTTLYFLSEGADANPHGSHAVYELELGNGTRMATGDTAMAGTATPLAWRRIEREESRLYQAALLDAPDRWLWDALFAPVTKSYPFQLTGVAAATDTSRLQVWLQGATDLAGAPDHHIRLFLNGIFVDEVSFDGKRSLKVETKFPSALLKEGQNRLEVDNVGDTSAAYSMVMLDKFELVYPVHAVLQDGVLEAQWRESGEAAIDGAKHVVDVTGADPIWLPGRQSPEGKLRFRADAGRTYLAVSQDALLRPMVHRVRKTTLRRLRQQADYLVIGPEAFLDAAKPLVSLRSSEGLSVAAVSVEDIFSEFGHGERTPDAIRSFIAYAYHHWSQPAVKYVLLLGDASYDPKDFLGTGTVNHVPTPSIRTTLLWTASDLEYASVNGDDRLPDIAIGRLPASSVAEVEDMVSKILTFESSARSLRERIVLVADDADEAGDFDENAEEISRTVLSGTNPRKIFLSELGASATKSAIMGAFDDGTSLMSYLGHGGIHLWAGEMVLSSGDIASMSSQERQPLLLTMNCLNGYFHFPYFDALSEELLKRRDRGIVAAFSPSGLSVDAPAHRFHKALLQALLDGGHERLGDAVLAAQERYAETGALPELLNIYHLFGDPALNLTRAP